MHTPNMTGESDLRFLEDLGDPPGYGLVLVFAQRPDGDPQRALTFGEHRDRRIAREQLARNLAGS